MRFPDIDWYCDECVAYLNDQPGFDDENGAWTCAECGRSTPISNDNIMSEADYAKGVEWLSNFDPKNYPLG